MKTNPPILTLTSSFTSEESILYVLDIPDDNTEDEMVEVFLTYPEVETAQKNYARIITQ